MKRVLKYLNATLLFCFVHCNGNRCIPSESEDFHSCPVYELRSSDNCLFENWSWDKKVLRIVSKTERAKIQIKNRSQNVYENQISEGDFHLILSGSEESGYFIDNDQIGPFYQGKDELEIFLEGPLEVSWDSCIFYQKNNIFQGNLLVS